MQGYLVSWIATTYGWDKVFVFLMICCGLSALMVTRLVVKELSSWWTQDDDNDGKAGTSNNEDQSPHSYSPIDP